MGGLRAAEQLRGAGWQGDILLIGDELHPPYNRPPLSKEVLASKHQPEEALSSVLLRQRASAASLTFRLGEAVVASNLIDKTITLASGETLTYAGLVIATGIRPRRLHLPGPASGRYAVRTLDDALTLRKQLTPGTKVLVVGCGFVGCEVAATALSLGCDVHLVEGSSGPMHRALGPTVSAAVRDWLLLRGVQMHTGSVIQEFRSAPDDDGGLRAAGVRLTDGTEMNADVIVEAVGSIPNTEWLQGNDLDLTDGVNVDNHLRVRGAHAAVAVGDVARYPDPWTGGLPRRVEHWQGAIDTAKTAAKSLVAELTEAELPAPYSAIPSFWSDVFGVRVQGVGAPHYGTECRVIEGSLAAIEDGVAVAYVREETVVGLVTLGLPPGRIIQLRKHLREPIAELTPVQLTTS